jgi:hypothetical protein
MDLKELGAYLRRPSTRDRLRVETRDWYDSAGDDPHFRRWLDDGTVEVDDAWQGWLDGIRANVAGGTVLRRVRVIPKGPLNDYLRFELGVQFPLNVEYGEQIRVLVVDEQELGHLTDCFVINGGERVAISYYDPQGKFFEAQVADLPEAWAKAAQAMWDEAVEYDEWRAAHPEYRQRRAA